MKHGIFKTLAVALLASVCALTAAAQVPDYHYLRFNEGTGSTTADLALPGLGAAPTVPPVTWDTTTQQLGAGALKLLPSLANGNNCNLNVPLNITGSWTIELWARDFESGTTLRYLFGDNTASFYLYRTGSSPAQLFMGGTGITGLSVPGALVFQAWTHLAFTYDATTGLLTAYVNGVQAAQNTQATNPLNISGTSTTGLAIGGYGSSNHFVGGIDEFRWWSTVRTPAEIMSSMNIELNSFTDDIAVSAITAPVSSVGCTPLTATETVSYTIRNYGSNPLASGTFFQADLSIDGGPATTEFFTTTNTLNSGDTESFTFTATANLIGIGSHTVDVTILVAGDLNPLNDNAQITVFSGGVGVVTSYPYVENFDGAVAQNTTVPPLGWKQDTTDATGVDSDWYMHTGNTSSSNTGPTQGDNTSGSGYYAYVEDSSGNHAMVNLLSPCLDLSSIINPRLQFYLFSFNGNPGGSSVQENFMSVDVIAYPGGAVTMDAYGPQGDLGSSPTQAGAQWVLQTLDLSPFVFQTIELRFRGTSNNGGAGNTFYHDQCIDDVAIFDFQMGIGQPGQPGTAVLDLNSAVNSIFGGGDPYSGDNGPYAANATAGSPLTFTLSGEPNQPMILLVGPMNLVVASYPNIGQFDIGGPLDPMGIPTLLQVIGDGFNPITFIDALHNTGATGQTILNFQTPPLPLGVLGGFQAAFATNNGFFFAMSNAVELTII